MMSPCNPILRVGIGRIAPMPHTSTVLRGIALLSSSSSTHQRPFDHLLRACLRGNHLAAGLVPGFRCISEGREAAAVAVLAVAVADRSLVFEPAGRGGLEFALAFLLVVSALACGGLGVDAGAAFMF